MAMQCLAVLRCGPAYVTDLTRSMFRLVTSSSTYRRTDALRVSNDKTWKAEQRDLDQLWQCRNSSCLSSAQSLAGKVTGQNAFGDDTAAKAITVRTACDNSQQTSGNARFRAFNSNNACSCLPVHCEKRLCAGGYMQLPTWWIRLPCSRLERFIECT